MTELNSLLWPEGVGGNEVTVSVWFPNETDESRWEELRYRRFTGLTQPPTSVADARGGVGSFGPAHPAVVYVKMMKGSEILDLNDSIYNYLGFIL